MRITLVIVVAFAAGIIYCGCLIARFDALASSPTAAAILPTFVFSLDYGYEGAPDVVC